MFQTNQRVECVDDEFAPGIESLYSKTPIDGGFYTIRDIAPGQAPDMSPEIAVTLQGLNNPSGRGGLERAFSAEKFVAAD